jgi:hypothetical protein
LPADLEQHVAEVAATAAILVIIVLIYGFLFDRLLLVAQLLRLELVLLV